VSNTINMSGGIRTLSPNEIETVSGGWAEDYKSCGDGLVPHYVDCSTWGDVIRDTVNKCNDILRNGGGTPA
jgi:hypothetical protein